jgi:hypothetical protein
MAPNHASILLQLAGSHGAYAGSRSISIRTKALRELTRSFAIHTVLPPVVNAVRPVRRGWGASFHSDNIFQLRAYPYGLYND